MGSYLFFMRENLLQAFNKHLTLYLVPVSAVKLEHCKSSEQQKNAQNCRFKCLLKHQNNHLGRQCAHNCIILDLNLLQCYPRLLTRPLKYQFLMSHSINIHAFTNHAGITIILGGNGKDYQGVPPNLQIISALAAP